MPGTAVSVTESGVIGLEIDGVQFTPTAFFGVSVSGTGSVQFFDGTSSEGNPLTAVVSSPGTSWDGDQTVAVTSGSVYAALTESPAVVAYLGGEPTSDDPPPA